MSAPAAVEITLERQERQRRAGVGVLSCLAAPVPLGSACWRRWCDRAQRPVVVLASADLQTVVRQWTAVLARCHHLPRAAVAFLAAKTGRPADELAASLTAMSVYERK